MGMMRQAVSSNFESVIFRIASIKKKLEVIKQNFVSSISNGLK
jgi:uncharacterized protein YfkK (UPF0435 family)